MNKKLLLTIAEIIDTFRVVPRAILLSYAALLYVVAMWFMGLAAPTGTQAAFVSTVVGIAGMIVGFYNNTGRTWKKHDEEDN